MFEANPARVRRYLHNADVWSYIQHISRAVTRFGGLFRMLTARTNSRVRKLYIHFPTKLTLTPKSTSRPLQLKDCVWCQVAPPLWSSGQSSWLQTQRSGVPFPALPDFLSSSGSGTGSTQPL
jgi:hypothetical protein